MERERIIISDLDLKILNYLKEEHQVTNIVDKFNFSFSQCKRHIERIKEFLDERKFGTFKMLKLNDRGKEVLEIWKI